MVGEQDRDLDLAGVEPLRTRDERNEVVDDRNGSGSRGRRLLRGLRAERDLPVDRRREGIDRPDDCDRARTPGRIIRRRAALAGGSYDVGGEPVARLEPNRWSAGRILTDACPPLNLMWVGEVGSKSSSFWKRNDRPRGLRYSDTEWASPSASGSKRVLETSTGFLTFVMSSVRTPRSQYDTYAFVPSALALALWPNIEPKLPIPKNGPGEKPLPRRPTRQPAPERVGS